MGIKFLGLRLNFRLESKRFVSASFFSLNTVDHHQQANQFQLNFVLTDCNITGFREEYGVSLALFYLFCCEVTRAHDYMTVTVFPRYSAKLVFANAIKEIY